MCSCGTDCVDATADEKMSDPYGENANAFGFFSQSMPENPAEAVRFVFLGSEGEAFIISALSPEQQQLYQQAYIHGNEDAVRTLDAVQEETFDFDLAEQEAVDAELEEALNHNFLAIAEMHNELADAHGALAEQTGEGFGEIAITFEAMERCLVSFDRLLQLYSLRLERVEDQVACPCCMTEPGL